MRRRIFLTALFLSPFTMMSAAFILYGLRVPLIAALNIIPGTRFTPVPDFPLRDSLPALGGGLSNLEAFKVTMTPSWRANFDRSLWVSDSIGAVSLEYVTERRNLDSVSFMVWTDESPLRTKTFRGDREIRWEVNVARPVSGWSEVVAVYQSFPSLIPIRSSDPSVSMFTQVEGKVFHVVSGWYRRRLGKALVPDTSYPLTVPEASPKPLQLLARGNALAIVNATSQAVRLRLLGFSEHDPTALTADSSSISVYRNVLRGRTRNLLAYTNPGIPYPVFHTSQATTQQFFMLMR